MTRTEVLERLRTILAGRAAEHVIYGRDDISLASGGGPTSDLAVATRVATSVVCSSGFGADGNLHWTSAPTAAQEKQIDALLRSCYRDAVTFLRARRNVLELLAAALVERQELDGATVRSLAAMSPRKRPATRSS
jgi:ATP-dependent Zn protease